MESIKHSSVLAGFRSVDNGFIEIGKMYAKKYAEDQNTVKDMVNKFSSVRGSLAEAYGALRRAGKCEDIKTLPEATKRELWSEAKLWAPNADTGTLIQICKSIIAIGALL